MYARNRFTNQTVELPSHSREGAQNETWIGEVSKILRKFGTQSRLHHEYAEILTGMLSHNTEERSTPDNFLRWWPGNNTEASVAAAETPNADEKKPVKKVKKSKTQRDTSTSRLIELRQRRFCSEKRGAPQCTIS